MYDAAPSKGKARSDNDRAMPLDAENKQRLEAAEQDHKSHQKVGDKLSKFLNRIADEIDDLDRAKRLELFRKQIKAHQYMDGNFYGFVDQNLEWQSREKASNEVWYSDNQLYPYFRTALMELSRTQTEIVIEAPPGASDDVVSAAKFAKSRYDANRARTFNARLKQTENTYALLNGITYRYTFFSFGRKEKIPVLEERSNDNESQKLCLNCSRPSTLDKCASCGSEVFREMEPEMDVVIGYKDVPTGNNAWVVPNPVGVIGSLQAASIEETPFLKWKQQVLRAVLQSKFKGLELPSTGTSVELRYISNQQKATPAGDGSYWSDTDVSANAAGGRELELLEFQQIWLDYPMYCHIKFDEDTPLGRGTLKAGQELGEMYPDGLYYARCGDLIVDLWNESKNAKWTSSPYGIRPGSMYGSGSSQALSDQEVLNDIETITMANMWANGVPKEFVDPEFISELSSDPTIPTKLTAPMGEKGNIVGRAYAQAPATTLSAEVYGMADTHKSSMQNKIGALSGTGAGGLQDSQKWGDTATAISIKRDLAVGRFSPDLELMADQLDKEQAFQFLENEQKFFTPAQWQKQKGEHGEEALKAFLECDIRQDLIISISPGSWMPKSDAQLQAKALAYANVLQLLMAANNPELTSYFIEVFGMPPEIGGWSFDKEHARKVIERMQALADLFIEQYGDLPTNDLSPITVPGPDGQPIEQPSPTMQVAQKINNYTKMPVDVFLDNHQAIIDALRDWRTTDKGQNASNVMLASIALRLNMHQEGIGKQGQLMTKTQMLAQKPLTDAAQEQQAQAGQAAQDQQDTALQAEGVKQLATEADKDDARQAEKDKQAADQAHEKDMLAAKQAHEEKLKVLDVAHSLATAPDEQDSASAE